MSVQKIKSPKTGRLININGDTYKKLLKDYPEDYLLSLKTTPNIIDNTNINNVVGNINNVVFTGLKDTDLYILHQIEDIYSVCRTNKKLYQLCMSDNIIKEKYLKQQKIHHRLDKIFNLLKQSKQITIVVNNIDDNNIKKYNIFGNYFFIRNQPKNKIKNIMVQLLGSYHCIYITKEKLTNILFDILNTNLKPIIIYINDQNQLHL